MAHELSFVGGKAQMFSVLETPWHKEGTILADAPSYQDALRQGGLLYPLKKMPYLMPSPQAQTGYKEAGDAFYVLREDTGAVLGSVGSSYEIVTNDAAFKPLEPLVDQGVLKLETGGVLRDGADAWLLGRWDLERFGDTAKDVFGTEVAPFATVLANHNGRRGVLLGQTPIRIVCANTLGAAETDGISRWETIAHTSGANERLVEAAERMFSGVVQRYEVIARQYKLLKATMLTPEMFKALVQDVIAPDPRQGKDWNPEARMAEAVAARNDRKRSRLADLFANGKGHTGEPNGWYAYNAAVEALDHDKELWPTRSGCYRTASLLGGQLSAMKERVLDGLVQYAQSV